MTAPIRRSYGPEPQQFGHFHSGFRRTPVVVVHGGFWRPHRSLDMTTPLAEELARRGWTVWNVEYRRVGQGGWRETLDDCAAAVDGLAERSRHVLLLGHSAGGHLAVWAAGRTDSAVRVKGAVSVGGVLDLERAARAGTGNDAVSGFLGGAPEEVPDRYRAADPMRRLPTGVPVRCVHSRQDERVPFEQSAGYVEAARRSGDDAELVEVDGSHVDGIDPRTPAGQRVVGVLEGLDAP